MNWNVSENISKQEQPYLSQKCGWKIETFLCSSKHEHGLGHLLDWIADNLFEAFCSDRIS